MKCDGPVMYSQTSTSCAQCVNFDKLCSFSEPQASASGSEKRKRKDEEEQEEGGLVEGDESNRAIIRRPKRMKSSMERFAEEQEEREDRALAQTLSDAYEELAIVREQAMLAELAAMRALSSARRNEVVLSAEEQEEEDGVLCEAVSQAYEALGKAKERVFLTELRAGRALSQVGGGFKI